MAITLIDTYTINNKTFYEYNVSNLTTAETLRAATNTASRLLLVSMQFAEGTSSTLTIDSKPAGAASKSVSFELGSNGGIMGLIDASEDVPPFLFITKRGEDLRLSASSSITNIKAVVCEVFNVS